MQRILKIFAISCAIFLVACSKEKFATINTNPDTVDEADPRFQLSRSIQEMYNNDYTLWFYTNFDYVFPWSQLTTTGLGNTEAFVEMDNYGSQNLYANLVPNIIDLRLKIDQLNNAEKERLLPIKAITYPLLIQPAMTVTDLTGSLVYSEAGSARTNTPPVLTPAFDNQETLFNTWLADLDAAIAELTKQAPDRISLGAQDLIYEGDYGKWAKYCNLLKLKIAARLVNANRTKALQIAEQVAASSAGYMDALTDDFLYNRGIRYNGTGNGTQPGSAGKNIVDFLVKNKDPRVRFIYTKNSLNAEVVQQFIDAGKPLPSYVAENVTLDASGNFSSWKGAGEPWVRYYGVPVSPQKTFETQYDDYFQQAQRNLITVGSASKTYASTSSYSEFIVRTNLNFTFPTKVGGRVIEQRDNYPGLQVILGSAAETNLYLAEFKVLGANLPKTAQEYFTKGVTLSVERMNLLAQNNRMPYYDTDPVYDGAEAQKASIKLKAGELDNLLAQPAYSLTTNALEKIYIQQLINFANTPYDTWTLIRRAGVFLSNSTLLPREEFLSSTGVQLTVPRRFKIDAFSKDGQNYANQQKMAAEQGFTTGSNDPQVLNSERLWFDKLNPAYGAGPKP